MPSNICTSQVPDNDYLNKWGSSNPLLTFDSITITESPPSIPWALSLNQKLDHVHEYGVHERSWLDIVCLAVDDSLPDFQSVFSVSEASQEWDGILSTCLYKCCYKFNSGQSMVSSSSTTPNIDSLHKQCSKGCLRVSLNYQLPSSTLERYLVD